jgi:hypothetical protein
MAAPLDGVAQLMSSAFWTFSRKFERSDCTSYLWARDSCWPIRSSLLSAVFFGVADPNNYEPRPPRSQRQESTIGRP